MATDNEVKIFYPDTIEYQPFTSEAVEQLSDAGSTSNKTASGTELQGGVSVNKARKFPPRPIPIPVVAKELISNNLNSQSRQILSAFTFNQTGSIQIGEYVSGVSGDIRISPNGIVARNSAGITTVSIDGTTGDATFLGTVSAGSVISASVSANLITGTIVNAQIADIEWAKITNVQIDSADIISLDADVIVTGTLEGIDIKIGSGNDVFKADSNGIYLGHDSFSSAPFRVNMDGDVTASSLTLTNASVGSGSSYTGDPIQASYIGNLTAGHITSGTITVGGTLQPTALVINESTNSGNSRLRFQRLSRIWEDNSARLGINSIGAPMFVYVKSNERLVIRGDASDGADGRMTVRGGLMADGRLFVKTTSTGFDEDLVVAGHAIVDGNLAVKNINPRASASYNCGGSGSYWNAVNTKYLTKHDGGTWGYFDDGVKMPDGKILRDTEALLAMKKNDKIKTNYGVPTYDWDSLPDPMRVYPKDAKGNILPMDKDGKYYEMIERNNDGVKTKEKIIHSRGEDVFATISILIGAVKELTNRVKELETLGNA